MYIKNSKSFFISKGEFAIKSANEFKIYLSTDKDQVQTINRVVIKFSSKVTKTYRYEETIEEEYYCAGIEEGVIHTGLGYQKVEGHPEYVGCRPATRANPNNDNGYATCQRMNRTLTETKNGSESIDIATEIEWTQNETPTIGQINVQKRDKDTGKILPGVKFVLQDQFGQKVSTNGQKAKEADDNGQITTGNDGNIKFSNLKFGKYKLFETATTSDYDITQQDGYGADPDHKKWVYLKTIEVKDGADVNQNIVKVENKKKKPTLEIIKIDSTDINSTITEKDKLKGARFDIINKNTGDVVKSNVASNCKVTLDSFGTYIIKETKSPYTEYYNMNLQSINSSNTVTLNEMNSIKTAKIYYYSNTKFGDLEITKVDSNTRVPLQGVGFKIYFKDGLGRKHFLKNLNSKIEDDKKTTVDYEFVDTEANAKEYITGTYGKIKLENLPVTGYQTISGGAVKNEVEGKYYIVETSLPENLQNYYEIGEEKSVVIYGKSDISEEVYHSQLLEFDNKLFSLKSTNWNLDEKLSVIYDNLIDINKWNNSKDAFKYMVSSGMNNSYSIGKILRNIRDSYRNLIKEVDNPVEYVTNILRAIDYTPNNGEVSSYVAELNTIIDKRNKNGLVTFEYENEQVYIDVSGYAWEDTQDSSKQNVRNNLYDKGETLIEGIPVAIKNKDGEVAKDEDGNELRMLTDKNGAYKFRKVKISELSNYYVEFEYNGLKYQNVDKKLQLSNGSKAVEEEKDRIKFNNSFASITGGNAKGETTIGNSLDENNNKTNTLKYKSEGFTSTLVQNTGYTARSANAVVVGDNTTGASIKANTNAAGYKLSWRPGLFEIKDINLGIYEREQPDMAVDDDVDHISLEINGYEHSYVYRKREKVKQIDVFANDGIFSGLAKWGTTPEQKQEADYPTSYTRAIYKNDANASGITGNGVLDESKKLRVNIIYKLVIKNESTSLEMSANEIASYYDETLDYVESWYMNGDNKVNVNWDSKDSKDGFKQLRTNSLKDVKIPANKSITVYLKMKKNTILKWAQMDDKYEENTVLYSEITSYSTYYDNKYYAGIDKDSAPDNVDLKNIKETGEDDTASAPDVNIVFKEPRAISGYVFEDDTDAKLKSNDERKGDGKYSADRDGFVGNVNVELLKASNGESVAYIYPKAVSELNLNAEEARYTTSKDGKGFYSFVGVIPDEYILKFTYGDGSVIYKTIDGNATEIKVTTQDYKSTIVTNQSVINAFNNPDNYSTWYRDAKEYSSAVDDYTQRIKINTALKDITNKSKTEYEAKSNADLQKIIAKTPKMKIGIENTESNTTEQNVDNQIDNIDFGIVERPRMSLKVTKEISHIKLTLANGQTLVDGDPRTTQMQYVTYPKDGILKIEVDNEIVEGSTVEIEYDISVENNSELDYNSEQYYKYGIRKNGNQPVGLTISSIVDYLDENLATTYNYNVEGQNIWKRVESKTLNDSKFISNDIYNAIKNKKNIFVNECQIKLQPGQKTNLNTINTLKASKLLTTANELLFTNYVETLKVSNEVGRFYGQEDLNSTSGKNWKTGTPGNFNPYNAEDTHESDDNKGGSTVAIIPPTGLDKNIYVIGSIIGIIILSAIAGVIVYIKKRKIK